MKIKTKADEQPIRKMVFEAFDGIVNELTVEIATLDPREERAAASMSTDGRSMSFSRSESFAPSDLTLLNIL